MTSVEGFITSRTTSMAQLVHPETAPVYNYANAQLRA